MRFNNPSFNIFKSYPIIHLLICHFVSSDLNKAIMDSCKTKPDYYEKTSLVLKGFGNALNKEINKGYTKVQLIPSCVIRQRVCDMFPKVIRAGEVEDWNRNVIALLLDLHEIDDEWRDSTKLKTLEPAPLLDYEVANRANRQKCKQKIDDIVEDTKAGNANEKQLGLKVGELFKCMNSAVANLRPGVTNTNKVIDDYMDPIVKTPLLNGRGTKIEDLTLKSLDIKTKYRLKTKFYKDGGILSSDLNLRPKWFDFDKKYTPCSLGD